jgi:CRP-like cAMP-binding protein
MWLEIYFPYQYPDQQEAQAIIEQAQQIPGLQVTAHVVGAGDLCDFFVGAVPIYLLDGQLLAAGHPPPELLLSSLRQRAQTTSPAKRMPARPALVLDVFRDLSPQEITTLNGRIRLRKYAKGEAIYWQGDKAHELFLLRKGRVELYHLTRHGKRLQLAVMQPGTFFGEMSLLRDKPRFDTAEVVQEAHVAAISRGEAEQIIREQPDFALFLVKELSRRLQLSDLRQVSLAYHDVSTRLATELLHLSRQERGVLLPITHQELGERSGLLRETVTKMLDTFQEEGLVELHRGKISLRNVAGLEALLEPLDTTGIL